MKIYNTVRNGMALKSSQKRNWIPSKRTRNLNSIRLLYSNNETSKTERNRCLKNSKRQSFLTQESTKPGFEQSIRGR